MTVDDLRKALAPLDGTLPVVLWGREGPLTMQPSDIECRELVPQCEGEWSKPDSERAAGGTPTRVIAIWP